MIGSIAMREPAWIGTTSFGNLTPLVGSYSHMIAADGGYQSCSFSIGGNREDAESWIFSNVGNDIRVYNSDGILVWRGFVNSVEVSLGTLSVKRGPMLDVGNSVSAKYQTPSYTIANVTIGGNQGTIAATDNAASIAKYGTRRKEISVGTATSTEATQVLNTWLNEHKEPPLTHTITTGSDRGTIFIKVSCMGYVHLLDYIPVSIAANDAMNLSDKITTIMGLDPDSIFSTDYSGVEANATQVAKYFEADQTALAMIKALVALGGVSPGYERYIWGIYDNLQIKYEAIPTAYEYIHRVSDPGQDIVDLSGNKIEPWDVVPGKFLLVSDFLIGRSIPASDFKTDPRIMFVESVSYTAPWGLQLSGGKSDTVDQKLARLGMGGL